MEMRPRVVGTLRSLTVSSMLICILTAWIHANALCLDTSSSRVWTFDSDPVGTKSPSHAFGHTSSVS